MTPAGVAVGGHEWPSGSYGVIALTMDGGKSWTRQFVLGDLAAVSFADASTGTAVGWRGTIIRTTDGGATWTIQPSGTSRGLWEVSFCRR